MLFVTIPAEQLWIGSKKMESDIYEVIERAFTLAGYKILDGNALSIIIRHPNSDSDYRVTVTESPC